MASPGIRVLATQSNGEHMPRQIVDISIPLQNDVAADPPGYGPSIRYFDHKKTAEEVC